MMEQGRQALRLAMPGAERQAVGAFQKAVALKPEDAAAWGLLALAQRSLADFSAQQDAAIANLAAEQAARRALELDPREPHALLTRMQMQRAPRLDWLDMEKELRRILAIDPANPKVLDILVALLQAAGYTRESWDLNEKAITLDGLRPDPQHRKALKLWILGRPDEADQQAAFVMQNWPLNNLVRGTRLLISTFTGRFRAASLLIEDPNTARILSTPGILMYTTALAALESHAPSAVSRARSACLAAAPAGPALSVHAVMLLSALNEVDAAYDVIEGFLLRRGLLVTRERSGPVTEYESDIRWRNTQWLFTPATKPLRGDPRFAPLCDVIGLDKYWNGRGVQPDERRQA
jgi:tetratricopeptide (TPR) repeat protein